MSPILPFHDTICAPATASGGAIAIVRVSGPNAIMVVDTIFSKNIREAEGYTLHYGTIRQEGSGETLDDVLVSIFRAPHSYTGEDSVEISCHGSAFIVGEILHLLANSGCRMARPGEFTQRAFLNGRMDLTQAEAVADVIASTDAATHRMAMSQMRGGITKALAEMREQLLTLTSLMELELDFSDHEDLEFADRTQLRELTVDVLAHVSRLADSFHAGNAIKNGIPVAIIGAPNVGKSTLLNALLQEDKAIVSDIKGTTRDVIEDTIFLTPPPATTIASGQTASAVSTTPAGTLLRFIDTAGIRHTDDTIEQMGIERSLKAAERAQIILLVTEPGVDYPEIDIRDDQALIRILNKSDHFQAISGKGLDALKLRILHEAARMTTTESDLVITNARHHAALCAARDSIQRVAHAIAIGMSGDLIAQDLRETLHHLAEITGGEITTDEVLGNIFQHFCIGK